MPNEDIIKEMERFVIFDRQDRKYFKLRDHTKNERGEYFKHDACNLWLQDGVAIDVFVPFKSHNKIVDKLKERITQQIKVIDGLMKDISHLKESNEIGLDVQRDKDREIAELQKSIKHMTDDTYIRMSDEMMEDFKAFKQRKVK